MDIPKILYGENAEDSYQLSKGNEKNCIHL
jgi:hypothetical protein